MDCVSNCKQNKNKSMKLKNYGNLTIVFFCSTVFTVYVGMLQSTVPAFRYRIVYGLYN